MLTVCSMGLYQQMALKPQTSLQQVLVEYLLSESPLKMQKDFLFSIIMLAAFITVPKRLYIKESKQAFHKT